MIFSHPASLKLCRAGRGHLSACGGQRTQRLIDKKTVFVLGAGASCPYGYPSGADLRSWICLNGGFNDSYVDYRRNLREKGEDNNLPINEFISKFSKSSRKSIDLFMSANPKLAPTGKYIIAYTVFKAEERSQFREQAQLAREQYSNLSHGTPSWRFLAKKYFQGDDWYLYLFNRLAAGLIKPDVLPDFSDNKISFVTFNYDRSLELLLYESLSNSFTEVPEKEVIKCLQKLKIVHVYGQISPLKWQDSEQGVDYRPKLDETLLQKSADNIKTIFEQKESPELNEARQLLVQTEKIFFLGFGYAEENLEILKVPDRTKKATEIYGTAFGLEMEEILNIRRKLFDWLPIQDANQVKIEKNLDCLKLLRNYF
jgi:hypothetical protein